MLTLNFLLDVCTFVCTSTRRREFLEWVVVLRRRGGTNVANVCSLASGRWAVSEANIVWLVVNELCWMITNPRAERLSSTRSLFFWFCDVCDEDQLGQKVFEKLARDRERYSRRPLVIFKRR